MTKEEPRQSDDPQQAKCQLFPVEIPNFTTSASISRSPRDIFQTGQHPGLAGSFPVKGRAIKGRRTAISAEPYLVPLLLGCRLLASGLWRRTGRRAMGRTFVDGRFKDGISHFVDDH